MSVLSRGADRSGTVDSTAAFLRAQDVALASSVRFAAGPGGAPQAGGRAVDVLGGAPALIVWDGLPGAEFTNVTLRPVSRTGPTARTSPTSPCGRWSTPPAPTGARVRSPPCRTSS